MEVILLERVEKLGQMGDVVTVKNGYARNWLLPQKKALRATQENQKIFEAQRAQLEADNLKRREEAESVASKISKLKVVMIRAAGDSGQLYGSVSSRDIAAAVCDAGVTVSRNQVTLDRGIKTLGIFDIALRLHPEVSVTIRVNIARSDAEAEAQWSKGGAVLGAEAEDTAENVNVEEVFEEGVEVTQEVLAVSEDDTLDANSDDENQTVDADSQTETAS